MTPLEVYREYISLKNHFSIQSYDYFKYQGKTSASSKSFDKRKDKIFFEKLARHHDPRGMLLANVLKNPKVWIRDLSYSEEATKNYEEWAKRMQSLSYVFRGEVSKLQNDFDLNFLTENGSHPKLMKMYLGKQVSLETLVILTELTGCMIYWDKKLSDPIWKEVKIMVSKYAPFIRSKYDVEKLKKIVVDIFQ